MFKKFLLVAVLLALAEPVRAAGAPTHIMVAEVSPIAKEWIGFVAQNEGFFAKNNVNVEVTYVGSPANGLQQLVGGAVDVASTTLDATLRAVAGGAHLIVLGCTDMKYPYSIMVDPKITSASALKTGEVSLAMQKDLTTIMWDRWLETQSVKPAEVDQIYQGNTPNRFAALSSHSVQAAMLSQPFDFLAAKAGFVKLVDLGRTGAGFAFAVLVVRPDWARANAEAVRGYLRAQVQAVDWLYDPANKARAIEILMHETKQDKDISTQTYDYYIDDLKPFSPGLELPESVIKNETETLAKYGAIGSVAAIPAGFHDASYLNSVPDAAKAPK